MLLNDLHEVLVNVLAPLHVHDVALGRKEVANDRLRSLGRGLEYLRRCGDWLIGRRHGEAGFRR